MTVNLGFSYCSYPHCGWKRTTPNHTVTLLKEWVQQIRTSLLFNSYFSGHTALLFSLTRHISATSSAKRGHMQPQNSHHTESYIRNITLLVQSLQLGLDMSKSLIKWNITERRDWSRILQKNEPGIKAEGYTKELSVKTNVKRISKLFLLLGICR